MAITLKQLQNSKLSGYAMNKKMREALINKLYELMPVINKYSFFKDEETNELKYTVELGTSNDSPVIREFGLSDKVMKNVKIQETTNNNNTVSRRIDIAPGTRYQLSENIILVYGTKDILADFTRNGLVIDGVRYEVASVSPSQEKHSCKYFARLTEEVPNQKAVFDKIEKINGYVYTGLFSKPVSGEKILKSNSRLGNYGSNMQLLTEIDLSVYQIAIVEDSITGAYDYESKVKETMDKNGIKIDNHINDGALYLSISIVQRIFEALKMDIDRRAALTAALQLRIGTVTAKCMSRTLEQEDMMRIAKQYNAKFYGNPNGELALLIDEDGAKLINEIDLSTGKAILKVYVMAMANASTPHTSGQHLIKYMNVDAARTLEIMDKLTTEALDNYITGQIMDGNNNSTVYAKIRSLVGEEALSSRMLMESLIKDTITYATSAVAKNRLAIEGIYSHMMFDLSYALTNGAVDYILGINKYGLIEAYSADICKKYAKEIAEIENDPTLSEEERELKLQAKLSATVIKFPSAGPDEYEVIVYQTENQIKAKIEKATAGNNKMKKTLKAYFDNTPWGCTVFAPVNTLKNKLAGADVDFDACMSDMSELKNILVEERMAHPNELGYCTFISYKDIEREEQKEESIEDELNSLDM
jgi:hypothetical protein